MTRGTAFLHTRAEMLGLPPHPQEQGRRARLIGNALRELDRFLNILVQATHASSSGDGSSGRYNTARRLHDLRAALSLPDPSNLRLRALGRSRACLFHCAGVVRRPDARDGAWMTVGWSSNGLALDRMELGETLSPTADNLIDTCRFYQAIADDLLAIALRGLSYRKIEVQEDRMHGVDSLPSFPASAPAADGRICRFAVNFDNFDHDVAPFSAVA